MLHDVELQLFQMEELDAVTDLLAHSLTHQLGRRRRRDQNERSGLVGLDLVIQHRTIGGAAGRHEDHLDRANGLLTGRHLRHRRIQLATCKDLRDRLNCLSLHYLRRVGNLSFHFTNEAAEL